MNSEEVWLLSNPGMRPQFEEVARHLWGDADFASDGNADTHYSNWTELTVIRRPDYDERVDIDPVSDDPLALKIFSSTPGLARRAAEFLAHSCGGVLTWASRLRSQPDVCKGSRPTKLRVRIRGLLNHQ